MSRVNHVNEISGDICAKIIKSLDSSDFIILAQMSPDIFNLNGSPNDLR